MFQDVHKSPSSKLRTLRTKVVESVFGRPDTQVKIASFVDYIGVPRIRFPEGLSQGW